MTEETQEYTLSIPKTELSKLPAAAYTGSIEVIDTTERIAAAVATLRSAPLIGFDTETRPSFTRGARYKVSLLQLSTLDKCFLFRLNHIGLDDELKALLEDEHLLKIGLSLHDDFHNLNKLSELDPKGFVDLQTFVKDYKIADNSLSRIYAIVFGKRISKNQRLTNWEAKSLTIAQQTYASLDAKACIDIYLHLKDGHFHAEESVYKVYPEEEAPTLVPAEPVPAEAKVAEAPKAPKAPKATKETKAAKATKETKVAKAAKSSKASKATKSSKSPKAPEAEIAKKKAAPRRRRKSNPSEPEQTPQ